MKNNFFKNQAGYFLVEALVAISVFIVAIVVFSTLLSKALSTNRLIADRFTANYLALEGIEISKNILDKQIRESLAGAGVWNVGFSVGSTCYKIDYLTNALISSPGPGYNAADCATGNFDLKYDPVTNMYSFSGPRNSYFKRKVRVDPLDIAGVQVGVKLVSEVTWTGLAGYQGNITLEDHFYNWR